jgi:uncharacterized membrane protein YfbV (UPF0208 family)
MKDQKNRPQKSPISAAQVAALRARFRQCQQALAALDWLSEGSVTHVPPGSWRWTRKVQAKTVTVALSAPQAAAFQTAIQNHRQLEQLIREMRALSQTYLLHALPGPPRRTHQALPPRP